MERASVLVFWVSFCCAVLSLLQRTLILGVASLNVLASTGLAPTLGEGTGIGLDAALWFTLGCNYVFLSVTGALNTLVRSRRLWCVLSERGWIGEGVSGFFVMLTRS